MEPEAWLLIDALHDEVAYDAYAVWNPSAAEDSIEGEWISDEVGEQFHQVAGPEFSIEERTRALHDTEACEGGRAHVSRTVCAEDSCSG